MKYQIKFIGYEPYFSEIELDADNKDHAENKAREYISEFYPELQDVELTEVTVG